MCILDIEVSGVQAIKQTNLLQPRYVFISPPSVDALEVLLPASFKSSRGTSCKRGLGSNS